MVPALSWESRFLFTYPFKRKFTGTKSLMINELYLETKNSPFSYTQTIIGRQRNKNYHNMASKIYMVFGHSTTLLSNKKLKQLQGYLLEPPSYQRNNFASTTQLRIDLDNLSSLINPITKELDESFQSSITRWLPMHIL